MAEAVSHGAFSPVERQLNLIPVGLKECALDSPTFRATAVHFVEQIDIIEKWLDGYVKAASKLVYEVSSLESLVNSYLTQSTPPAQISEAVLDHDYTMLALKRYSEGAREFWQYTLRGVKKYDTTVVDPIKHFMSNELKTYKDAKRSLESSQRTFDGLVSRYASQGKTKEASSLREDAFQLYEGRKAYLKSAMDFCTVAPQLRASLDKLLVSIFADQWKEMRSARESNATMFTKWNSEMDRVRGWSKEMENSERAFHKELLDARRQIEDNAETLWRPSRELDDYNISTVSFLGGATSKKARAEKQGWLFQKTLSGKPARTIWSRRWFFVRNGIFGWLIQGSRSGGVEESEKIGVLLCSVRAAAQEERRFCFEIKTKDTSIVLQAETQAELSDWISAFEMAKRKALEDPASTEPHTASPGIDPAFAISPPVAPEFAAKTDERSTAEESNMLGTPDPGITSRASFDVTATRKVSGADKDEGKEGSRLMSKLEIGKRQASGAGGIASLIAASHNVLPVSPGVLPAASNITEGPRRNFTMPSSTLAPSTLANPPAPTNLSHTAVIVSTEKGFSNITSDGSGMPSGLMANLWGSSNWGYVNRIGNDISAPAPSPEVSQQATHDDSEIMDGEANQASNDSTLSLAKLTHRKTVSTASPAATPKLLQEGSDQYPPNYPPSLKAQDAQFRMLFPSVPRQEKLSLVFRATWNPNEMQEFPGRVYVTTREAYFYSHHLGLVLITGASLTNITEVTAAPGRDCDFLYLHLKETGAPNAPRRITIKTFLEPLKLLRRRLNFLVHNANSDKPDGIEEVMRALLRMEIDEPKRRSSMESWEEIDFSPIDDNQGGNADQSRSRRDMKASLRIDGNLYGETMAKTGKELQRFKLPSQPVQYAPKGMQAVVSRGFNVSAKALFHVIFGDKSAVFQLLYCNRWGDVIEQSPWVKAEDGRFGRRIQSKEKTVLAEDSQTIDVLNEHLCYVVTNVKQPWRLPYPNRLQLVTKMVITHSAKSKCKLAIFQQTRWIRNTPPAYLRGLVQREALNMLEADALDLTNIAMDQVAKLGNHSKTNKAVDIFGSIGQQLVVVQVDANAVAGIAPASIKVKPRKAKVTMAGLLFDDAFTKLLNGFSLLLNGILRVAKGVVHVCNAHTILVMLLLVSAAYNTWYTYSQGLTWTHERSAGKYMARLGITPDRTMGKAVYLHDIHELISQPVVVNASLVTVHDHKTCQSTFQEHLSATLPGTSLNEPTNRLYGLREALARYRHDLLVALRVVNRVERNVVEAEWQDWARSEDRKCSRIEHLLRKQQKLDDPRKAATNETTDEILSTLGADFDRYCRSCRQATTLVPKNTVLM